MAQAAQIVAQEDARIGMQGTGGGRKMIRTRVPSGILNALDAQDGEYIRWTAYSDGTIMGQIISAEDANPRDIIAEKQASAKKAPTKKKAAAKVAPKALAGVFDDDEDEDDGSEPDVAPARKPVARKGPAPIAAAVVRKPAPAPVAARRPAPTPVAARVAIAKPGVARKGVRYRK